MPTIERRIGQRGPRFYLEDGVVMFVFHYDASTRTSAREATTQDALDHEAAWTAFEEGNADAPFRPLVEFVDPEDGPPPREPGMYETRRRKAERA